MRVGNWGLRAGGGTPPLQKLTLPSQFILRDRFVQDWVDQKLSRVADGAEDDNDDKHDNDDDVWLA